MSTCQERSSAKWKELFRAIQLQDKPDHSASKSLLQLLLNMPIRWSSTYVMLDRAEKLKEVRCCPMWPLQRSQVYITKSIIGCRHLCSWNCHCWEGSWEEATASGPSIDRGWVVSGWYLTCAARKGRVCTAIILIGLWASNSSHTPHSWVTSQSLGYPEYKNWLYQLLVWTWSWCPKDCQVLWEDSGFWRVYSRDA